MTTITTRTYRSRVPRYSRGAFLAIRYSAILIALAAGVVAVGLVI